MTASPQHVPTETAPTETAPTEPAPTERARMEHGSTQPGAAGDTPAIARTILSWDDFSSELLRFAWQPALRFALDWERAAERCPRRRCKLAGGCRMAVRDGETLDCGGGLSDETLSRAGGHALFGCAMLVRFFEQLELLLVLEGPEQPEPDAARRRPDSRGAVSHRSTSRRAVSRAGKRG